MLDLIISGIDVSEYVADYEISRNVSKSNGNAFKNWDGTLIDENGRSVPEENTAVTISASLTRVPRDFAATIANAVKPKKIEVNYASPSAGTGIFNLTSYRATSRKLAENWDIDLSLESDETAESSEGFL